MPISDYLRGVRAHVGPALLLVPGVAAVIHDAAGRLLLQRRSDNGLWSLPGGTAEPGETPAETVVREVFEETGLIVTPTELIGLCGGAAFRTTYPNGDEVEATVAVFACRVEGGRLAALDGESLELLYFPPAAMPPLSVPYPPAFFLPRHGQGPALFEKPHHRDPA